MSRSQYGWLAVLAVAAGFGAACGDDPGMEPDELECGDLDPAYLADGGVGGTESPRSPTRSSFHSMTGTAQCICRRTRA